MICFVVAVVQRRRKQQYIAFNGELSFLDGFNGDDLLNDSRRSWRFARRSSLPDSDRFNSEPAARTHERAASRDTLGVNPNPLRTAHSNSILHSHSRTGVPRSARVSGRPQSQSMPRQRQVSENATDSTSSITPAEMDPDVVEFATNPLRDSTSSRPKSTSGRPLSLSIGSSRARHSSGESKQNEPSSRVTSTRFSLSEQSTNRRSHRTSTASSGTMSLGILGSPDEPMADEEEMESFEEEML